MIIEMKFLSKIDVITAKIMIAARIIMYDTIENPNYFQILTYSYVANPIKKNTNPII